MIKLHKLFRTTASVVLLLCMAQAQHTTGSSNSPQIEHMIASARASSTIPDNTFTLPTLRGLQGVDDQTMVLYAQSLNDNGATLSQRYEMLDQDLQSGMRRYNAFWSSVESSPVVPSSSPITCPAGYLLTPANETDKIARGYLQYHCYSIAQLASFDDALTRDALVGAASGFIMYGSPSWAQNPNCTGFPWGSNMYKSGCLPWNALDAWYDYANLMTERYANDWGTGKPRVSALVMWNEVQSQGWSDPSPILPNRFSGGSQWTEEQFDTYAGMLANMTIVMYRAAQKNIPDIGIFLSTDHFTLQPPLNNGDVGHVGLYDLLNRMWPLLGTSVPLSIAVHPYDAGDPRQNLTSQGIYTFATLKENVADFQCAKLVEFAGISPDLCSAYPQVVMWASEQGWPYNKDTMNKTLQARNICYAHGLSMSQNLWSVTHNFFQGSAPSSQGDAGDFSLVDEPPVCTCNLTTCAANSETYQAYMATAPGVYGVVDTHYCCTRWGWGCVNEVIGE